VTAENPPAGPELHALAGDYLDDLARRHPDLAAELLGRGQSARAVHDSMLAHGSPPVSLLRTLV
jgi:hypothetical protein